MNSKLAEFKKQEALLYISYTIISGSTGLIYNIDKVCDICYPKYNQSLPYSSRGKGEVDDDNISVWKSGGEGMDGFKKDGISMITKEEVK